MRIDPGCIDALEKCAAAHRDPSDPQRFHGPVNLAQIDERLRGDRRGTLKLFGQGAEGHVHGEPHRLRPKLPSGLAFRPSKSRMMFVGMSSTKSSAVSVERSNRVTC